MNYIEIQNVSTAVGQPDSQQFQQWVDAALSDYVQDTELLIRIVDEPEIAALNHQYRQKSGSTNILSFPFETPEIAREDYDFLGDLIICAPVVEREALEQHKVLHDHWAHMLIHGVLHLLGYDHRDDDEAKIMEEKEISILQTFHINNPYR